VIEVIEVPVSSIILDAIPERTETSLCVRPILAIRVDRLLLMALPETEPRNAALVAYSPMTCSFITTQNYDTEQSDHVLCLIVRNFLLRDYSPSILT